MIWHPEPKDAEVGQYLKHVNHAPYFTIFMVVAIAFCLMTAMLVAGSI